MLGKYACVPQVLISFFRGKHFTLSFDITNRCSLRCSYCYWQKSKRSKELSKKQIIKIAKKYRQQGIVHVTWIGGEPTLRFDVLQAVTPLFSINWVVTNGLTPIKNSRLFSLPQTWIILSLDGVGQAHDQSRGHQGLYQILKKRFWNKPLLTTTTLHKGNKDEPERLLKEWSQSNILAMVFDFATPIGKKNNQCLMGKERDEVIDRLMALKKEYGRLMANSLYGLNLLKSAGLKKWTGPKRCILPKYNVPLDELGKVKKPCVLGSSPNNPKGQKPLCQYCGCHVPTIFMGVKRFDWQTIDAGFWFLRKKNPFKNN